MQLKGSNFIAGEEIIGGGASFTAIDPRTGKALDPAFHAATGTEVDKACRLADAAFDTFRQTAPEARAALLDGVASELDAIAETAIARASLETGLPPARLEGEMLRTTTQLRMFAGVLREGAWAEPRIVPADAARQPLPRPDLRARNIGVGPVAVFGASNFPFAYSVAGGDTASALAAGCPVVVKGHPAHPGTSELVARAITRAVAAAGLPGGVFSMVIGPANELGAAVVTHPAIQSVGFTGSRSGGVALMKLAAERAVPIPVHAEMGSINPVFLLPGALSARAAGIADGYVASLTASAGQFCTNPGLVIALAGEGLDAFVDAASKALAQIAPAPMLTPGIHAAYTAGLKRLRAQSDVAASASGKAAAGPHDCQAELFTTSAQTFLHEPVLSAENFGASSVVVTCRDGNEMRRVGEALEGQLTASVHGEKTDMEAARSLLPILERKVGRIIFNGWPTGVEVNAAMVHGGPFPASSDGRTTAVGPYAIRRFLRPVSYQNFPPDLLPGNLKD